MTTLDTAAVGLDLDRAWDLHPQVSVRPEPFGALLYHFGTRKLSFLKDRRLLTVVRSLADAPTARAAFSAAGVVDADVPRYQRALETLARSSMIVERPAVDDDRSPHDSTGEDSTGAAHDSTGTTHGDTAH
ncbi:mycofactocin biosynthesis chaperone MftB [Compostimonas suwonensis]|uniref:Putative mycofactocin binding protein MftB n=1 Tax=Compostimonas suwonensis TaxID=1048394 RepID=A0A2M9BB65_9MICO|nr:mycofactocin biosynthesis chaperone MftB [Compostimonas suwonensis]PJJ55184.1 putative mycofactocin binding protein MftB [Compostimonas suwonensis]